MKEDKNVPNKPSQNEAVPASGSDIGPGMMLGAGVGLCIDPAVSALRKTRKQEIKRTLNGKNRLRRYVPSMLLYLGVIPHENMQIEGLTVVRNYKSCGWGREWCDRKSHAVFLPPKEDSAIIGSARTGISTSSTKLKQTHCSAAACVTSSGTLLTCNDDKRIIRSDNDICHCAK